jgi:hypothetical protein
MPPPGFLPDSAFRETFAADAAGALQERNPLMASIVIASITVVPLVLLVWDIARTKTDTSDRFAGPARTPVG